MKNRRKINGYLEPDWEAEGNQYSIRSIISNLFATSQYGNEKCEFCGNQFSSKPTSLEESATLTRHGKS